MNRITLAVLTAALAASATTIVRAQDPTRPTPPARHAKPERPAPRAAPVPRLDLDFPPDMIAPMAIDIDQDAMREALRSAQDAMRSVDMDQIREQMRDAQRVTEAIKLNGQAFEKFAPLASLADIKEMGQLASSGFSYTRDPLDRQPPAPWAQGDPADSVYRVAREALNRGDYGRAAQMFAEISQKYPKSVYQTNAVYFEALARYKVGTTEELKAAARALEPLAGKATSAAGSTNTNVSWDGPRRSMNESEIVALYTRINGALAQRGDRDAAAKVEKVASQNGGAACDQEDMQVKAEALNALSQMDPAGSLKILRSVLDRHDACTAPLRRNAIFILGRRGDAESSSLIASVAKSDPDVNVRSEAINFLAKQQGDAGLAALEDILRTDQDERIQRAAMRSLMSSDNPKARSSIRALIERKDAPIG